MPITNRVNKKNKNKINNETDNKTNQNNKMEKVFSTVAEESASIQFELSEAKYSLDDLILPDTTHNDLKRAIGLRKHQKAIFEDWGLSETHKYDQKMIINLYGEPGTGKTMAAHAIAKKLEKSLLIINYSSLISKYHGETSKNIEAAFEFAKKEKAILFFDEADTVLSHRINDTSSSSDVSINQSRSVMLTLLNDYDDIVLFATNLIKNFDPAFMRRILMHIEFPMPDVGCRERLFKHYISSKLPNNIDIKSAAFHSETLSGADISNSILLAAFGAKEEGKDKVEHDDLINKIEDIKRSKEKNSGISVSIKKASTDSISEYLDKPEEQINNKELEEKEIIEPDTGEKPLIDSKKHSVNSDDKTEDSSSLQELEKEAIKNCKEGE